MRCEYFTFKWCLTLYACFLPAHFVQKIFHLFLDEGWPAIYKIGISIMQGFIGEALINMDSMIDVTSYFREDIRDASLFPDVKMR